MYCTKCGKQIDYDSPICRECVDEMAAAAAPTEAVEPKEPTPTVDEWQQLVPEQPKSSELQPGESVEVTAPVTYVAEPTAQPETSEGNPRMRGFGKALAAAILGFVGYFFAVFTMAMATSALEMSDGDMGVAVVVFFIMSIPLTILPLIFGIKSIRLFKSTPKDAPKPIATLVLGIVGLAFAALSVFFLSLVVTILFSLLAYIGAY